MAEPEAGRELDALVAEKVMGWKRGQLYGNGNGEWIQPGDTMVGARLTWHQTPQFSTDIAAAWDVVERMRTLGYGFTLSTASPSKWCAGFGEMPGGFTVEYATCATTPLAICRAALACLPTEEPK